MGIRKTSGDKTLTATLIILTALAIGGFTPEASASVKTCGTRGSVSARMKSCASRKGATKAGWKLVSRSRKGREVWKDTRSGLLWADLMEFRMDHKSATRFCANRRRGQDVKGTLGLRYRLPTLREIKAAHRAGLKKVLPRMDDAWFWTSTAQGRDENGERIIATYDGVDGKIDSAYAADRYGAVRCVAYAGAESGTRRAKRVKRRK